MARILVVDDEPSIVLAVKDELVFEGHAVDTAVDGPGALGKARAMPPDVLLLDLMLPGLNGFEICRQLRPELPEMWIIIFTVRGQEADRITGFEAGADDYVTKPFSLRASKWACAANAATTHTSARRSAKSSLTGKPIASRNAASRWR